MGRAVKAAHRAQRRPLCGHQWGFKIVVRNGVKYLAPDPYERALMQFCLRRKREGATERQICIEVEERLAAAEKRKPRPYGFSLITRKMVATAIKAELRIQAAEKAERERYEALHRNHPVLP